MTKEQKASLGRIRDAYILLESAANRCGSASARIGELIRDCERHEREHRREHRRFCRGRTGYKMSVSDAAMCFAVRAIVSAKTKPPKTWPELDLRSDFILGPIVAHYIREVKGSTLGLSKSLRDAVLAFDYVKDVAP